MTDISVIILAGKEERHIGRCLEKLAPLEPRQVFVVESQTGDRTHERAIEVVSGQWLVVSKEDGASQELTTNNLQRTTLHLVWHTWPGNQAAQFNWALDNLDITSKWVMRLDADEYLTDSLIARIKAFVAVAPSNVDLVELRLGRTWQGKRVRFGMPPKYIPRLFRFGACRYGAQVMDERLETDPARTIRFKEMFIDDNLNSFEWWREKHLNYAKREAQKALSGAHGNKSLYYKCPPYLRAIGYWGLRYFVFCGFLDGRAGWSWNFWQGLWYRWQVDREIGRQK